MLEAQVHQASLWKRLVDCIGGMVEEANLNCNPGGLSIQAMDSSHVALLHLLLRDDCFVKYQCERNSILGLNFSSLTKVLKIVDGTDSLTIRHEEDGDFLTLASENAEKSRKCEYQLKLLEIESPSIAIPEMDYPSTVTLSSTEFAKIIRDMAVFGEIVTIAITRNGIKFSSVGDVGEGYTFLQSSAASGGASSRLKSEVKKENEVESEQQQARKSSRVENAAVGVEVQVEEPMTLSFSLRLMNVFAKGSTLSDRVTLKLSENRPCVVEYLIDNVGHLRYYLAPKVVENY